MGDVAMRGWTGPLIALAAALAAPAAAEAPDAGFTFKRIGLPAPGAPRITVRIEAPPPVPAPAAPAPPAAPAAPDGFWAAVSPALAPPAGRGPARLLQALEALEDGGPPGPPLRSLAGIVRAHGPDILSRTVGTRVSPALALAVIAVESSGRPGAVSPAGAAGLMQLMPATAARFGVADRTRPDESIRGGVAYLDWLLARYGDDPVLALAGYNAGEGAVDRHGGVPPFPETRAYVPKVLAAWKVARALCATPPVIASDGCAFALPG